MKTWVETLNCKLYHEKYLEGWIPFVWDWQVIQSEKVVFFREVQLEEIAKINAWKIHNGRTTPHENSSNTSKNSAFQDLSVHIRKNPQGPTEPPQEIENQSKNYYVDMGPNCSTGPVTPKLVGAMEPDYFSGILDPLGFKLKPSRAPRFETWFF